MVILVSAERDLLRQIGEDQENGMRRSRVEKGRKSIEKLPKQCTNYQYHHLSLPGSIYYIVGFWTGYLDPQGPAY